MNIKEKIYIQRENGHIYGKKKLKKFKLIQEFSFLKITLDKEKRVIRTFSCQLLCLYNRMENNDITQG